MTAGCDMAAAEQFTCGGCARNYAWKPALAGKRVKCKCGQVMAVPAEVAAPESPGDDDLYDFADIAAADATAAAEATARADAAGPVEPRPTKSPAKPEATSSARALPKFAAETLAYQREQNQRQQHDRFNSATLIDMNRDLYVPVGLLAVGLGLYVANFAVAYKLGGSGIAAVGFALGVLTLFKAAMLVGFALIVAGPLGVSFGGIFTAALKLAAIAVFSDGCTAWTETLFSKLSPGFGSTFFTLPISTGIYWGLITYLFSMDPGDSWLVVIILNVFDFIIRNLAILLLLRAILSMGGVSASSVPMPGFIGGGTSSVLSERTDYVNQLKEYKQLQEARKYIADGHQVFLTQAVEDLYNAGAKNVWFEVTKDINQKGGPVKLFIEMPKSSTARKRVVDVRKAFYESQKWEADPADLADEPNEPYLEMRIS